MLGCPDRTADQQESHLRVGSEPRSESTHSVSKYFTCSLQKHPFKSKQACFQTMWKQGLYEISSGLPMDLGFSGPRSASAQDFGVSQKADTLCIWQTFATWVEKAGQQPAEERQSCLDCKLFPTPRYLFPSHRYLPPCLSLVPFWHLDWLPPPLPSMVALPELTAGLSLRGECL